MRYEVNYGTLAIVPNTKKNSLIYEDENRYIVEETPFEIMEDSCRYFGSTYDGRKDSAKDILGSEYKIPIIVEDTNNLIVFPTTSPQASDCAWVSLNRIKSFEAVDAKNTRIIFDNNKELIVPTAYRSIENQISRAIKLDYVIRRRKNISDKNS